MGEKIFFKMGLTALALYSFIAMPSALAETLPFQLLYQKNGNPHARLGYAVANAGDVNGDGKADFVVGAPHDSIGGSVFVYSGATGALLIQKSAETSGDEFGYAVAGIGDANGDGRADFIVGAPRSDPQGIPSAGTAYVYSGATGALLYQKNGTDSSIYLGWSVSGIGDVNGDSRNDFAVGAPLADSGSLFLAGAIYVYSGLDGSLLHEKHGYGIRQFFGYSMANVGDMDKDNKSDLIVGAPETSPNGVPSAGSIFVYSGATGMLLLRRDGTNNSAQFGTAVAGAGDVDGDGMPDFIVGVPQEYPNGLTVAGSIYLYSGATGNILYQKSGGGIGDRFGFSVAGAGDINGDGKSDFLVGAPSASPNGLGKEGYVCLFSGATGDTLFRINGTASGSEVGYSVNGIDDVSGDGKPDLIIGTPGEFISANAVYVYSLIPSEVSAEKQGRPRQFELSQNYPNPFNPSTTIYYRLGQREKVTLEIFNLLGERVKVPLDEDQSAGEHTISWDGKDRKGKALPSGIYLYRLTTKDFSETKKMLLLK